MFQTNITISPASWAYNNAEHHDTDMVGWTQQRPLPQLECSICSMIQTGLELMCLDKSPIVALSKLRKWATVCRTLNWWFNISRILSESYILIEASQKGWFVINCWQTKVKLENAFLKQISFTLLGANWWWYLGCYLRATLSYRLRKNDQIVASPALNFLTFSVNWG